ncbi:hypothetical protein OIE91_11320 [Streptomyces albidoflavus]|uniref:hypothetical protein n=1 Tax=Streptomyces albidoflavus TaxID=1886 RepID=UPI00352D5693
MRTTDATGRTITLGDHVGGTTSGRYQGTISGPAIQLGKGQVKLLVTNCPYRGTSRPENGDDVWISTDRLFLIHPATDRRFVGYRSPDGRTWTQATRVKGVLWEAHEEPDARYKALALRTRYGGDLQPVWAPAPVLASMSDRSAELEALDLGEVDGRVSATCPDPDHPTWLRAPDDTRGCPWCRVEELEQAAAWSGANRDRWADVHDLVEQAIEKGYTSIPTEELESALGPDPATDSSVRICGDCAVDEAVRDAATLAPIPPDEWPVEGNLTWASLSS